MQNYLKNQTSPYLLQHADNPVNWYPWCKEAFEKAKAEDKPFFAGTYFPKHARWGSIGFLELLETIAKKWKTEKITYYVCKGQSCQPASNKLQL